MLLVAVGQPGTRSTPSSAGSRRRGEREGARPPTRVWRQEGAGALTVGQPVTLIYDNGEGLEFRRTIAVDDKYLFTVKDEVANKGAAPVTLYPYALISRHGTPQTLGYYILHEGLIGVLGDQGLQEDDLQRTSRRRRTITFDVDQRLARHHRQILGGDAAARHRRRSLQARFSVRHARHDQDLSDRLSARPADGRAGRDRRRRLRGCSPAPRKSRSSTATTSSSSSTASSC